MDVRVSVGSLVSRYRVAFALACVSVVLVLGVVVSSVARADTSIERDLGSVSAEVGSKSSEHVDIETHDYVDSLRERFGDALPEGSRIVVDDTSGVCYVVGDGFMCPLIERDGSAHIDGAWAETHHGAVA